MTKTQSRSEVTVTPNICANFSTVEDATVEWQQAPSGCKISQDGEKTWPFNLSSPITLPTSSIIEVAVGPGTYSFEVSCCPQGMAVHTVTVT